MRNARVIQEPPTWEIGIIIRIGRFHLISKITYGRMPQRFVHLLNLHTALRGCSVNLRSRCWPTRHPDRLQSSPALPPHTVIPTHDGDSSQPDIPEIHTSSIAVPTLSTTNRATSLHWHDSIRLPHTAGKARTGAAMASVRINTVSGYRHSCVPCLQSP